MRAEGHADAGSDWEAGEPRTNGSCVSSSSLPSEEAVEIEHTRLRNYLSITFARSGREESHRHSFRGNSISQRWLRFRHRSLPNAVGRTYGLRSEESDLCGLHDRREKAPSSRFLIQLMDVTRVNGHGNDNQDQIEVDPRLKLSTHSSIWCLLPAAPLVCLRRTRIPLRC